MSFVFVCLVSDVWNLSYHYYHRRRRRYYYYHRRCWNFLVMMMMALVGPVWVESYQIQFLGGVDVYRIGMMMMMMYLCRWW